VTTGIQKIQESLCKLDMRLKTGNLRINWLCMGTMIEKNENLPPRNINELIMTLILCLNSNNLTVVIVCYLYMNNDFFSYTIYVTLYVTETKLRGLE